jgi:arylsulfatase A-like enzyme
MHTWQMEEAGNHFSIFPSKFSVYPDLLEEAGYHVGYTGKPWGPGSWQKGGRRRNPAGTEYNAHRLTPPANTGIKDCDYAANFAAFLADRQAGQPFCFWYGGHEPHRKYVEGEGLRGGKTLEEAEVPAYLPDEEAVRSDLLDYAYEIEWFDRQLGLLLEKLEEIGELDNTLIVVTSDNGMPFPRVKGQMFDTDFRLPLAVCWRSKVPGGRVSDDLVSFTDYAPTFLEAAGVPIHPQMVGRSLIPLLTSDKSGHIEPNERVSVYMGRERHDLGSENDASYPVRCVRTGDYLYIRNFQPELWPAGNPETGFTNTDSSPTKSLIIEQNEQGNSYYFNLAFGKHPLEELYHVANDPNCFDNLAENPLYAELKQSMWDDLSRVLEQTRDPRILGNGDIFNTYEYIGHENAQHSWRAYKEGRFKKQKY